MKAQIQTQIPNDDIPATINAISESAISVWKITEFIASLILINIPGLQ